MPARAHLRRDLRCQGAPPLRELDLAPRRGDVQLEDAGRVSPKRGEMCDECPDIAPRHRSGQRGPDPERPGVAEGALDERSVDRQRAGLVETRHPAQLRDGVEQGHEPPAARTAAA